ncbi:MAG: 3-isopropylmalate dehydrogenase [Gammaproteobacteria bacterium]|nr:3-isopropylmalate dehydrogenase [Gammaproteobacteria bacterium]
MSRVLILPGDGIGPEITAEARKVLDCLVRNGGLELELDEALIGGAAVDAQGDPLPAGTLQTARDADAVLLAAVGAPRYDTPDRALRPETGLLRLRKGLGLYANLRPATLMPGMAHASSLKPEKLEGLDLLIVRELTGGLYFGEPRALTEHDGRRRGVNTMVYDEDEVSRIARSAFQAARLRSRRVCSVDKANVLEVSELWRTVVGEVAQEYPDVELSHLYVDNAAMQLVAEPTQFDVMVTGNLFGDILSDIAAQLTGSIGLLPSASLNEKRQGLYEPVHGSAPDLAGTGQANPLAMILSVGMMLRYSLQRADAADAVEGAVRDVLEQGLRTADLADGGEAAGTAQMGDAVIDALKGRLDS